MFRLIFTELLDGESHLIQPASIKETVCKQNIKKQYVCSFHLNAR
jgi:hypothetical protein